MHASIQSIQTSVYFLIWAFLLEGSVTEGILSIQKQTVHLPSDVELEAIRAGFSHPAGSAVLRRVAWSIASGNIQGLLSTQ